MAWLKRIGFLGVACAAASGLLTACKSAPPQAAPVPIVPVVTVSPATLKNDLIVTAEFTPYQDVDVMAKVAGYVKWIGVDIGDRVHANQVLATLEVPEIQDDAAKAKAGVAAAVANVVTARAAVQQAEAGARIAALSFNRIQDVSAKDPGLVPRQDVDVAQSRSMQAAAELASAQSELKAAQENKSEAVSEYLRAQAMMQYATIRAPFDGVITKRYANTGSMIQAGTSSQTQAMPIVRLAQNNLLRLILPVPVSDVADVRDGDPVDVDVVSLGRTLKGKVTRYADTVQMDTRTMDTEVDVPNPDGSLVPGVYAEVHLHLAARPNVLSVPLDAIDGLGTSAQQAWLVRNGVLHLVPVTIGLQTASRVQIVSGLQDGDKVVVGRHSSLAEGEKVQPEPASYEANTASANS